jgi:hypothetical protein
MNHLHPITVIVGDQVAQRGSHVATAAFNRSAKGFV